MKPGGDLDVARSPSDRAWLPGRRVWRFVVGGAVALLATAATVACSQAECAELGACEAAAAIPDAGVPSESEVIDAGPDVPLPPMCPSKQSSGRYCWDFSREGETEPQSYTLGSGKIEVTGDLFQTPPRAGRATINAQLANPAGGARVERAAAFTHNMQSKGRVRFTASFYLDAIPTEGEVVIGGVRFDGVADHYTFFIAVDAGGASLVEWQIEYDTPNITKSPPVRLSRPILARTWTRIAIEASAGDIKYAEVTIDGQFAGRRSQAWASGGAAILYAGIVESTSPAAQTVYVDDLLLEALPP